MMHCSIYFLTFASCMWTKSTNFWSLKWRVDFCIYVFVNAGEFSLLKCDNTKSDSSIMLFVWRQGKWGHAYFAAFRNSDLSIKGIIVFHYFRLLEVIRKWTPSCFIWNMNSKLPGTCFAHNNILAVNMFCLEHEP